MTSDIGVHPVKRFSLERILPLISILLMVGGFLLVGMVAWTFVKESPLPYSYELQSLGKIGDFPELGEIKNVDDVEIGKYAILVADVGKPVAEVYVAGPESNNPVLLEWRNNLTEPVITLSSSLKETEKVADAITKHTDGKVTILGWWDTSRRLKLLTGADVVFDGNLAKPVLVPAMWAGSKASIEGKERDFWKASDDRTTRRRFDKFVDALLSDELVGAAKLRQLLDQREGYIVLHLSDAYKIGALAPDRFSIGYRDFATTGSMHDQIKRINNWIREQDFKAHAVMSVSDHLRRVYFLTDETSQETLIARMLPFNSSNPFKLPGLNVVFQRGGYWVFKPAGDS